MMKTVISGGSGFVGRHLAAHLVRTGHEVTVASRGRRRSGLPDEAELLTIDPYDPKAWENAIAGADAVVNLAGASIFRRWTAAGKKLILESRVRTTRALVTAINLSRRDDMVLVNASAVGYYGVRGGTATESDPAGNDFLARVAAAWEEEAKAACCRVVLCRFGVVLGKGGGAIARMLPVFRAGLGSPLGRGGQPFPWIHISDLIGVIMTVISNRDFSGPLNCVAPDKVDNREFSRSLARALGRPFFMPAVPAALVRLVAGGAASILLSGRHVESERMREAGFAFRFPGMETALEDITGD